VTGNSLRVLAADGEREVRRLLRRSLATQGYIIYEASSGQEVLAAVADDRPDLVLLDIDLPDLDGIEVTRRLRTWTSIPVIILSIRDEERAKIAALDAGADDYLTKPFGIGELMARIRVAMRHTIRGAVEPAFKIGDLSVDLARRRVSAGGRDVRLTPTEYDLLRVLVQHAGQVLTYQQLLLKVWGKAEGSQVHLLQATISNLRRKIELDPSRPAYVLCEAGVGYRLQAP
jgi:two-component system, OmpR family, KDP operon response regulator KdpE